MWTSFHEWDKIKKYSLKGRKSTWKSFELHKDQLKACFRVRFKVFVDEQQVPEHEEMDEKDESPEACHHFLIVDGEQPVATAVGMNTSRNSQIAACSCLERI